MNCNRFISTLLKKVVAPSCCSNWSYLL